MRAAAEGDSRAKVNRALGTVGVRFESDDDNVQYCINASAVIVRLIAASAEDPIGNMTNDDDKFVAGIFSFATSNHLSHIIGAPFEMVASIVPLELFGTDYSSEVASLGDSFNTMSQEGRVIEAIGQNVAKWIATPTDDHLAKLVALYRLCKTHAKAEEPELENSDAEDSQNAVARQAIEVAKLVGAKNAREVAEITKGGALTDAEWKRHGPAWERNWREDDAETVNSSRKAAERGDAEAQFNLGVMYATGAGVPEDDAEAVKWFRKAAEQGDAIAQCNLGNMYAEGKGVPANDAEAVKWFRKAAEQGFVEAQLNLSAMYANGKGAPEDGAEAVKWFRKAAAQGESRAQFLLGLAHANGEGVPEDGAEAVKWFRKAAEQGFAPAQSHLGVMYANGRGVPEDGAEAVKWFRKAAEQGVVEAQFDLGVVYAEGKGVPQDDSEAMRWFRIAAEHGNAKSQSLLGFKYANGDGVQTNRAEALKWLHMAAKQGDAAAQHNLGAMHNDDHAEALSWYRLAAEQGYALAQHNLGVMYARGEGVPQDFVQAFAWLNLAAAQGNDSAIEAKNLTQPIMTTAQILQAQELSTSLLRDIKESTHNVD